MIDYKARINDLRKSKNAVIVAHYYQNPEIQDLADKVGDSYDLSKYCANTDAEIIVFCGVHFMAESAKLLSPEKKVLLPVSDAGCPMADMADAEKIREMKSKYDDAMVVCYINTTARVKAECDVTCTSSNAVNIIRKLPAKNIIFVPDKNLGSYIATKVPEKNIILYEGYCPIHNEVTKANVVEARKLYPDAELLVHPECPNEVVESADFVGSTKSIIEYCKASSKDTFIIGTEEGILHKMKKDNPEKKFIMLKDNFSCADMKKITLKELYESLENETTEINIERETEEKAKKCLFRMLELS